jgi:hypothetical protein
LTTGAFNSYPLYYFTPSETADGRYLVFHSERGGYVNLYRLTPATGEIVQLTDGQTTDSGWAIWCEWHLRGIRNHLSSINVARNEVYYFEDDEIRATRIETLANRRLATMPAGRLSIGQTDVSPDGKLLAFIHADAANYTALLKEREALIAIRQFNWNRDHQAFRDRIPTTLAVLEVDTGSVRTVVEMPFHFHHALFVGNGTILVNHPRGEPGMWVVRTDGAGFTHWRPSSAPGTEHTAVNHQVVTGNGVVYEAVGEDAAGHRLTRFGRFDPPSGRFTEATLPLPGYCHAGFDPAGTFDFVEHAGPPHEILVVHPGDPLRVTPLVRLRSPDHDQQRYHAHPFLSRDRKVMYFTDWDEAGFAQICAMPVGDLTGA